MSTPIVLATCLAIVFTWAAVAKLFALPRFESSVRLLLGIGTLSRPIAVAVPLLELSLAVGLQVDPLRQPTAAITALLLLSFTGVLAQNRWAGNTTECNCFGGSPDGKSSLVGLARNIALTIAAVSVVFMPEVPVTGIEDRLVAVMLASTGLLIALFLSVLVDLCIEVRKSIAVEQ